MKITVIIPTYERPEFLRETLESVWMQTILPDEIVIGDDSKSQDTADLINNILIPISPVPIKYFHHTPSLLEVKNVDFQYTHATGDLVLHLHDDDPIYPNCIEDLRQPFIDHPQIIASFGLQRKINEDGSYLRNSEIVNKDYFRTPDREGLVDGFIAGATAMFPNNSFLVRREEVISIGYSDHGRAGKATDFYFGLQLGKLRKPFYFVNKFTAKCRLVKESQSRMATSDNAYRMIKILFEDLSEGELLIPEIDKSIRNNIPMAITVAARVNDKKNAFKWLFSKYYRNKLIRPRGIKRIILAVNPF